MRRPEFEEFKRLTSQKDPWGMADNDVVHLCDYILHLEAQNASMRRTFGSDPIFREKDGKIAELRAIIREIIVVMDNEDRTPEEMLLMERANDVINQ